MKEYECSLPWDLPWEADNPDDPENENAQGRDEDDYGGGIHGAEWEPTLTINEVSHLLDQMIMDIQHLELEVIRARYRLSFHLVPPYDEYLRMEIFSNMGARYGGDPVYDQYLAYCGMGEYDDAIDTPFHLKRKLRLAAGHDDYPDYYP